MAIIFNHELTTNSILLAAESTSIKPYVVPTDFPAGDFRNLLQEIKNTNANLLKGQIAIDTGYKIINNVNTPPQSFTTTHKDKLTFWIMFRLPFFKTEWQSSGYGTYANHYGDPLTTGNSWTRRANLYRDTQGLNKLNSAGEEVNSNNEKIYDYTTQTGYNSISAIYPKDNINDYRDLLFTHTDYPTNKPDYNKIPIHFFRMAQDENPYRDYYVNRLYFRPHWPEVLHEADRDYKPDRVMFRRRIKITSPTNLTLQEKKDLRLSIIQSDTQGYYVQRSETSQKIRINFYNDAIASNNPFELRGCVYLWENIDNELQLFAQKPDPNGDENGAAMDLSYKKSNGQVETDGRRYLIENYTGSVNHSGLTIGGGIDIGAAFPSAYSHESKWIIRNITGPFSIRLGETKYWNITSISGDISTSIEQGISRLLRAHLGSGNYIDLIRNENDTISVRKGTNDYIITIKTSHTWIEPNNFFIPENTAEIEDISTLQTKPYNPSVTYNTGDKVRYHQALYECKTTTIGNIPTNTTFWKYVEDYNFPFIEEYGTKASYTAGNKVLYDNKVYECLTNNTGFNPFYTRYWKVLPGASRTNVNHYGSIANYVIDDLVIYYGRLYKCKQNSTGHLPTDDAYWEEFTSIRAQFKFALDIIYRIIIRSFYNTGNFNNASTTRQQMINALTQAGVEVDSQDEFTRLLKMSFTVRYNTLWVHFRNHYRLIRSFGFGQNQLYAQHLRALYNEFFLPEYYNKAINALRGDDGDSLRTEPNEIEKYVLVSAYYHRGPTQFRNQISALRHAINSHDYNKLLSIVNLYWTTRAFPGRQTDIRNFIQNSTHVSATNNTVLSKLYRGVK